MSILAAVLAATVLAVGFRRRLRQRGERAALNDHIEALRHAEWVTAMRATDNGATS